MQINKINVDHRKKELIQYGSIKFPIQVYLDDLHNYDLGYIKLHWHKEFQFSVVLEGEVEVSANDASIVLRAGEGVFINSEVLHSISSTSSQNAILFSIIVSPQIANVEHGLIYENYIHALVNSKTIPYIELRDAAWQQECIRLLTCIYQLDQQRDFGYELLVISCLAEIWNHLVVDSKEILISHSQINLSINQQRINMMLNYIHTHFHESIKLVDIANSVNISTSECNRCFQKLLGITPIEYLIQVRLEHAITLLVETNMPVIDIAFRCGFNHLSYFGKVFKDYKGMSPTRFRDANKKANA